MRDVLAPTDFAGAAAALVQAAGEGRAARVIGGATKQRWGGPVPADALELRTTGLDRLLEHNVGDLTATVQAGMPLARLRDLLAQHGQMLAIDPPLGPGDQATVGGVFATADSGPLSHRYGAPRDLALGMTVALSDGVIARAGGKVIKNVAGYDLAKLFTGSFGTLGVILSVSLRLHPLPPATATARAGSSDPGTLQRAAIALAAEPLELEALDVTWRDHRGELLARVAGARAAARAQAIAETMRAAGLDDAGVEHQDAEHWERQRTAQRSVERCIVRVAARPSRLGDVIECARALGGSLVGRAALGTSYVALEPAAVAGLRARLPARAHAVVLDVPAGSPLQPWDDPPPATLTLMRHVKARFDPAGVCNPGAFVGGI